MNIATVVLLAAGCSDAPRGDATAVVSPLENTAFRVRSTADAPLNRDAGWAAAANGVAEAVADRPFRIRFEVAAPEGAVRALPTTFTLQARRNGGPWRALPLRDFPSPDELSTPRISLVRVDEWGAGTPTSDLLRGSELLFVPGEGVSDPLRTDSAGDPLEPDRSSAPWPPTTGPETSIAPPIHGEWEWPVVIRRWADGAVTNESGDVFDLRMVDGAGFPVSGEGPARVTLRIPEGHVGGTFAETPGVLGPWQGDDGTLYFPMEPAETFNVLMVVASPDHGASWVEVDGANRPVTDDLEGVATARHDGVLYLLHQISEATYLHAFDTRAAPGSAGGERRPTGAPTGGWVIRDELVSEHTEPPTQVAALAARSDASLVAVYGDAQGLRTRVRSPAGRWGVEGRVDVADGGLASGVMAVRAADDAVHLAYTVTSHDGRARSVWHRTMAADGTVTAATRLGGGVGVAEDEIGALLPLGWLPGSGTVVAVWRRADGTLWERRIGADGGLTSSTRISVRPVVQSGADSEQVGADLVVHEGVVQVVFIDEATRDLWHTSSPEAGVWTRARPVVEGVDAQWVRGRVVRDRSGEPIYGLVYDAGSDGGSGMNRFHAIELESPGD